MVKMQKISVLAAGVAIAGFGLVTASGEALAQADDSYRFPTELAQTSSSKNVEFTLTPKIWLSQVNANTFSPSTFLKSSIENVVLPQIGASLGINPKTGKLKDLRFVVNLLYGESQKSAWTAVQTNGVAAVGTYKAKRLALEILGLSNLPGSNVQLFFGCR